MNKLTIEQKAEAFDRIMDGTCTGMGKMWENFSQLQKLPNDDVLRAMAGLAAQEALELVLEVYEGWKEPYHI